MAPLSKAEISARWRANHPDRKRESDRKYRASISPEKRLIIREQKKAQYRKNIEHSRAKSRECNRRHRTENKEKCNESKNAWADEHKEAKRAQLKLKWAVRSGRVTKLPCSICGSATVHAHHQNYNFPLDVVWLCPAHHTQIHAEGRRRAADGEGL